MAAIDRVQTGATQIIRNGGHDLPRNWVHEGYIRRNKCKRCGMEFKVTGYRSIWGVSACYPENAHEECSSGNSNS